MKVKFANAEVDVWKLRKGTVVRHDYSFAYLDDIGAVDLIDGNYLMRVYIKTLGMESLHYSDELEWLEPF